MSLLKKPTLTYRMASEDKELEFIKSLVENFSWNEGKLIIHWKKEFDLVSKRPKGSFGRGAGNSVLETSFQYGAS